ncbi:MAG: phospholipase [Planctomycetes bacterium]|nr:phospholipase [Planctomycetota bacterium]
MLGRGRPDPGAHGCLPRDRSMTRCYRACMRNALLVWASVAMTTIGGVSAPVQDPVPVPGATMGSVSVRVGDQSLTMPYRLMEPSEVVPGETYPLVVFLHGSGERGTDGDAALKFIGPVLATREMRTKHPCYVLAVQCPRDRTWVEPGRRSTNPTMTEQPSMTMRGVMAALDQVIKDKAVDRQRMYLTGLSLGGYGAWDLAMRRPEMFAAVVPISGGGDPTKAALLRDVPIQVWHGGLDSSVPVARSRDMVKALKEAGAEVDYHEIKDGGHEAWVQAYAPGAAIAFMFKQVRDLPKPGPGSAADPVD